MLPHQQLAWCHLYRGDWEIAKKHIDRALQLNPNAADALANASYILAMLGYAENAVECGQRALQLNPRGPDWYTSYLSTALFTSRRYSDAWALRESTTSPFIDSPFFCAATLAYMGRLDGARRWSETGLTRLGATSGGAQAVAQGRVVELLLENNPYHRREDRDPFTEGMRKAGSIRLDSIPLLAHISDIEQRVKDVTFLLQSGLTVIESRGPPCPRSAPIVFAAYSAAIAATISSELAITLA